MEKEKNNKGLIAVLIIIIIILLTLVVLLVTGTISLNRNTIDDTSITTVNEENEIITYNMVQSDLIATLVSTDVMTEKVGEKMYIVYPVINYNNEAIKKLNSTIKANVDEAIKRIIEQEDANSTACETFKIEKTGEEKAFDHFVYNKYSVIENEKYLSIIEMSAARTTCASGSNSVINTYVVNKDTKKVLYNTDLYKEVNKAKLLEYINNSYDQSDWGEEKKDTVINNITKVINENKFLVYYNKNNNIVVTFPRPEHPGYLIYKYNGNTWSDDEEPIE